LDETTTTMMSLVVGAVKRFRQVLLLQRQRQLEGLPRVAQICFAFPRKLPSVRERYEVRAHRVSPLL